MAYLTNYCFQNNWPVQHTSILGSQDLTTDCRSDIVGYADYCHVTFCDIFWGKVIQQDVPGGQPQVDPAAVHHCSDKGSRGRTGMSKIFSFFPFFFFY